MIEPIFSIESKKHLTVGLITDGEVFDYYVFVTF